MNDGTWEDVRVQRLGRGLLSEAESEILGDDDPAELYLLDRLTEDLRPFWNCRNWVLCATDHTIDDARASYGIAKHDLRARIVDLAEHIIEKETEK